MSAARRWMIRFILVIITLVAVGSGFAAVSAVSSVRQGGSEWVSDVSVTPIVRATAVAVTPEPTRNAVDEPLPTAANEPAYVIAPSLPEGAGGVVAP